MVIPSHISPGGGHSNGRHSDGCHFLLQTHRKEAYSLE